MSELLHIVAHHGTRDCHISVSIKTAKTLIDQNHASNKGLFYIKVTSSAKITKDTFEELLDTSDLLVLLSKLDKFENESHLCLQHHFKDHPEKSNGTHEEERHKCSDSISSDGATEMTKYHSLQLNLKLCEGKLVVERHTYKTKKLKGSVIYLRVLASSVWMIQESRKIHNFMSLLRVFKPHSQLLFYTKIGGVISETEFSVASWKWFPGIQSDMVTDIHYFLQDSGSTTDIKPVATEPSLLTVQALTRDNTSNTVVLQIVAVAAYVPVDASHYGTSCVTLTMYGQNFTPLQYEGESVLTELDWAKYGMKISVNTPDPWTKVLLPHDCMNEVTCGSKHPEAFWIHLCLVVQPVTRDVIKDLGLCWMTRYLPTFLCEQRPAVLQTLSSAVDKAMKPVKARLKTQQVVEQSIQSVCSAITDIVCLSGNNSFRDTVFRSMQVEDSVGLKEQLQCRLTDISQRCHSSVWGGYSQADSWKPSSAVPRDSNNTAASSNLRGRPLSGEGHSSQSHLGDSRPTDWFADQDPPSVKEAVVPQQRDLACSGGKNVALPTAEKESYVHSDFHKTISNTGQFEFPLDVNMSCDNGTCITKPIGMLMSFNTTQKQDPVESKRLSGQVGIPQEYQESPCLPALQQYVNTTPDLNQLISYGNSPEYKKQKVNKFDTLSSMKVQENMLADARQYSENLYTDVNASIKTTDLFVKNVTSPFLLLETEDLFEDEMPVNSLRFKSDISKTDTKRREPVPDISSVRKDVASWSPYQLPVTEACDGDKVGQTTISKVKRKSYQHDHTPDISRITHDMQVVSPFQDLGEWGHVEYGSNGKGKEARSEGMRPDFRSGCSTSREITPVISSCNVMKLTKAMEVVSPFQQLEAEDCIGHFNSPEHCLYEDPFNVSHYSGREAVDACTSNNSRVCKDKLRMPTYSKPLNEDSKQKQFDNGACGSQCVIQEKINKRSFSDNADPYLRMMNSKDFQATYAVVSDIVDDLDASIQDSVVHSVSEGAFPGVGSVTNTVPEIPDDSDEWFDDVLMGVDEWLQ
ncbi:uncharacterized protein LOC127873448 isoform X2 [Dreissena polymorpha]|uniref:uncharacterized protein LOC127873448 isoform X2 n=1 Tax=Dreissena polymorpha TaxID=45954 RepID=UPI00226501E8|nr:uncharacterized protein LOC127873448 isoform X2 [Dreissena polymorpha]